jgi:hypothetical protein
MRAVISQIFDHDSKCEGVSLGSNLGRRSMNGRPGARLLPWFGSAKAECRGRHGRPLEGAQAHFIGDQTLIWFFLHDLGYERNLFCPLTVVEPGHKRWPMGRQLGRRLAATRSSSSEATASRSSPTSSSWTRLASKLVEWLQSVRNSSNLVAVRVRWIPGLVGENPMNTGHYL